MSATNQGLADLFLTPSAGSPLQPLLGGTMTAWNGGTYANTVVVGSVTYTNLPVINPTLLSTGLVLVAVTAAGPIILGRIFKA